MTGCTVSENYTIQIHRGELSFGFEIPFYSKVIHREGGYSLDTVYGLKRSINNFKKNCVNTIFAKTPSNYFPFLNIITTDFLS